MKTDRVIVGLCLAGFLVRVLYSVFFNDTLIYPDEKRFWKQSMSFVEQGVLKSGDEFAHDMPLTALFAGVLIKITGCGVLGIKILFAAISSLTAYLVGRLSFSIVADNKAAILGTGIAAFYPFFIYYSSLFLSETLFVFWITLLFYTLIRNGGAGGVLSGFTLGCAHLTRPTLLYFFPVFWGYQFFSKKIKLSTLLISILITAVIISIWGIRNMYRIGQLQISTSGSGQVLWEGNNPWNETGGVSGTMADKKRYLDELPEGLNEVERDQWKKNRAVNYIKEEPVRFLRISIKRVIRFWNLWPNSEKFSDWKYKLASLLSYGLVLIFSFLSIFFLKKRRKLLLFFGLFIFYYTLLHAVTIGSIRYRLPLEPILIAIASATITEMLNRYKEAVSTTKRIG